MIGFVLLRTRLLCVVSFHQAECYGLSVMQNAPCLKCNDLRTICCPWHSESDWMKRKVCTTCNGSGRVKCPMCDGKGGREKTPMNPPFYVPGGRR